MLTMKPDCGTNEDVSDHDVGQANVDHEELPVQ